MPTRAKGKKNTESGFEKSLTQLRDVPLLPPETLALVETTAETVGNTKVLAYGINNALNTFFQNFGTNRMKYERALLLLRVSVENACLLHRAELEVSAAHMEELLRANKWVPASREISLIELDEEKLHLATSFVLVASTWRSNGGRGTWKQDGKLLIKIIKEHHHEIDRVCDAIRSSQSISGPFVAVMDSLSTPLALGAL